jgi:hypothetical protein
VNIYKLNILTHLQYKSNKNIYLVLFSTDILKTNKTEFDRTYTLHLRYNYNINNWLTAEAYNQIQSNKVLNVEYRWIAGSGLRFAPLNTNLFKLHIGLSYMYEYEHLIDNMTEFKNTHRLGSYLSCILKLQDNIRIVNTAYFQPSFEYFNDYKFCNQTDMKFNLSKRFIFKLSYIYSYNQYPAFDIPKETYSLQNTLGFEF